MLRVLSRVLPAILATGFYDETKAIRASQADVVTIIATRSPLPPHS